MKNNTVSYTCYRCLSPDGRLIRKHPDFPVDIFRCEKCGLIQSGMLPNGYLQEHYRSFYRPTRKQFTPGYIEFMKRRAEAQKQFILKFVPDLGRDKRILEIGAGAGELIKSFSCITESLYAFEFDPGMTQRIKDSGKVNIMDSQEEMLNCENRFDLILMSHVFEHINDPLVYLGKLHRMLAGDGFLFIEVPIETETYVNSKKFKNTSHLFSYDAETFQNLIDESKMFDVCKIATAGITLEGFVDGTEKLGSSFDTRTDDKGLHLRCLLKKRISPESLNYESRYELLSKSMDNYALLAFGREMKLRKEVGRIKTSLSCRLTEPMRKIKGLFRDSP